MRKSHGIQYFLLSISTVISLQVQAATLIFESGKISGITDLDMFGELWEVTFHDGSFNTTYTLPYTPPPINIGDANIVLGDYIYSMGLESTPELFVGCTALSRCHLATPTTGVPSYGFVYAAQVIAQVYPLYRYGSEIRDISTNYADVTWVTW